MRVNNKRQTRRVNPVKTPLEPIVYEKKSLVPKEGIADYCILGNTKAIVSYMKFLHSDVEPAIKYENGNWTWYKHGLVHRDDGPALRQNGDELWYRNGILHREGGPAVVRANGIQEYWVDGIRQELN
jgi:hypothetical protein